MITRLIPSSFNFFKAPLSRRIAEVEDELSDLFLELATDDSQLHYLIYYAIGRDGKTEAKEQT